MEKYFWEYERVKFTLAKSQSVATAVVIGTIPSSKTADDLHVILQAIPVPVIPEIDREREPNFNCRVWIREAVRRMNIMGYIQCPDVDALEAEIIGYGKEAAEAVEAETFIIAKLRPASKSR
ncbi:uncharacterized protein EV420DRAFT_1502382 [Desarmillaria tabescens]|uniref:Uncharacterized protein n=1 Tax=Armillaria tabescens TaxID=1929756 RepID=A0AA39NLU2_ARMTA|nr:uncharacterized protein EV420DRAFT_1502382 [Desarmillaria tabescens]KAK0468017.1 hypothetical protein EV420DRAFT_1502382 [Desarmillaria tabescens]